MLALPGFGLALVLFLRLGIFTLYLCALVVKNLLWNVQGHAQLCVCLKSLWRWVENR